MSLQNVSGIQTNVAGERHIPQSTRADGSVRKEIKVRPGYRPPEDVERYKNRTAEEWKSRRNAGPPGAETVDQQEGTPAEMRGKNAKRREARKRAKQVEDKSQEAGGEPIAEEANDQGTSNPVASIVEEQIPTELNGISEQEKQARNIKKKLRQARDLQNKKESGESLLPEQFAKVIKISELIRQLDALGFDSNGDPKAVDPA